jgi:transposase InsO family protein
MQKNELIKVKNNVLRILDVKEDTVLVIDCIKRTMPKWESTAAVSDYENFTEEELLSNTGMMIQDMELLDAESRRFVYEHYTLIAGILPFVSDVKKRNSVISMIAEEKSVSKQTIRNYLCLYLVYQDISVLAPKKSTEEKELTQDEKNMRWALNKFFYNRNKNSIATAYTMMLKEKYCDSVGVLLPEYPSIHQFRYFYKKYNKMQTYYISRNGLKNYQRNNRPLLGDGVQEFAPNVGVGMLDATICDIYLINEAGNLVGRPILTACIDAYSSLCCGYALSWEGGVYSLRGLMLNVIADKKEWCKQFGIPIKSSQWNNDKLPAVFVTDMGSEYKSENFEQISELGVTIVNLPSYRPELKGSVEKFFDLVQDSYKPYLKGKGVIEPDYQERGSHDYRKDACLTMADFEKVILRCIVYYNSQRIIENFPYTEEMLKVKVQPFANQIYEWGKNQIGANLINVDSEQVILTLLPRTTGKYTRYGLKVNKLRYHCEGFTEQYLKGGSVTVAYNPDDVTFVWVLDDGVYHTFELIESRFQGKDLIKVQALQEGQRALVKEMAADNLQAQINLAEHIEIIAHNVCGTSDVNIKNIRNTRKREQNKYHVNYMKGGAVNE